MAVSWYFLNKSLYAVGVTEENASFPEVTHKPQKISHRKTVVGRQPLGSSLQSLNIFGNMGWRKTLWVKTSIIRNNTGRKSNVENFTEERAS